MDGVFAFCNPCALAEKLRSATLIHMPYSTSEAIKLNFIRYLCRHFEHNFHQSRHIHYQKEGGLEMYLSK